MASQTPPCPPLTQTTCWGRQTPVWSSAGVQWAQPPVCRQHITGCFGGSGRWRQGAGLAPKVCPCVACWQGMHAWVCGCVFVSVRCDLQVVGMVQVMQSVVGGRRSCGASLQTHGSVSAALRPLCQHPFPARIVPGR